MRIALSTSIFFVALSGASCSSSPKYEVDNRVLSDVPLEQKRNILAAEAEMNQAAEEKRKAQADVAVDDRDISVAEMEHSQAKLESDKVAAEMRLAKRGKDLNQVDAARSGLLPVEAGKRTSEAKVNWLKARRDFDRAMVDVAEAHGRAAARRVELEKARLVQATGKRPSQNFSIAKFDEQAAQAQREHDEARSRAERLNLKANQLGQTYSQMTAPRTQL